METLLRRLKSANPRKLDVDALAQFAQIEYTQQFKHFISKEREIKNDIFLPILFTKFTRNCMFRL